MCKVLSLIESVHYIDIKNEDNPEEIRNELVNKLLRDNQNIVLRVVNYEKSNDDAFIKYLKVMENLSP